MKPCYVVILDRGTVEEREQIHALLKAASNENGSGWWHHFADAWIVQGKSVTEWRNLANEALRSRSSSVLVMRLPDDNRYWALGGSKATAGSKWLRGTYFKRRADDD